MKSITIDNFKCDFVEATGSNRIVYMIYPAMMPFTEQWLENNVKNYNVSVAVVYVPSNDWNDILTPWPSPGEAKGFPPFAGKAGEFQKTIQTRIIPEIEGALSGNIEQRDLIGVSLSGLFALWQWMLCDTFRSIACLSGSYWYSGFLDWFEKQLVPEKKGRGYFLLGDKEPEAPVKAYQSVGKNTLAIVERLKNAGLNIKFEWVPGNHFANPLKRAEKAFANLYQ